MVTVFFQGNHASRAQAAKYTGQHGLDIRVTDTVTDHVSIKNAPHILYNLFTYNDLECIGYGATLNPIQLATKAVHYLNHWYYGVEGATHYPYNYITNDNVGGERDVRQCLDAIRACIKEHPTKKIILFGCSRGASTVVTCLVSLEKHELSMIKLVIVEAPFDSVPSVLVTYNTGTIIQYALEKFSYYNKDQTSPLYAVSDTRFPLDVPIVFITSDADTTVPRTNTMRLVEKLRERDHTTLHHIELKKFASFVHVNA